MLELGAQQLSIICAAYKKNDARPHCVRSNGNSSLVTSLLRRHSMPPLFRNQMMDRHRRRASAIYSVVGSVSPMPPQTSQRS